MGRSLYLFFVVDYSLYVVSVSLLLLLLDDNCSFTAYLHGKSLNADTKQDVFVLGLVLFKVWTGRDYFGANLIDSEGYLQELAKEDFQAKLPDTMSPEVRVLLSAMLHRKPEERISCKDAFDNPKFNMIFKDQSVIRPSIILKPIQKLCYTRISYDTSLYIIRLVLFKKRESILIFMRRIF